MIGLAGFWSAGQTGVSFQRLGVEKGLSQGTIHAICQDRRGFLWFATDEGLNRFDGYTCVIYRVEVDNPASISGNCVFSVCEDRRGRLWVGVWGGGLNRFDPETERFTAYVANPRNPRSLSSNGVITLLDDPSGDLWVGTEAGLNRFDPETGRFTVYRHDPGNPATLSHDRVAALCLDRTGALWVGTDDGLNRLDPQIGRCTRFKHSPEDAGSLCHNRVLALREDRAGNLWVGTAGGLCRFDRTTGTFVRLGEWSRQIEDLPQCAVNAILEDGAGALWFGTSAGLLHWPDRATPPERLWNVPGDPASLSGNNILALAEDRSGVLWVGTQAYGLSSFKPDRRKFKPVEYESFGQGSSYRTCFGQDAAGTILIGTSGELQSYDGQTFQSSEEFRRRFRGFFAAVAGESFGPKVVAILGDRTGAVWVASWGRGLFRLDADGRHSAWYRHDPADANSLSSNEILTLYEDRAGVVWVGTDGKGLNRFNKQTGTFTRYQNDPQNPNSISNDYVMDILDGDDGTLWVGTWGFGIDRLQPQTGVFQHLGYGPNAPGKLSGNVVTRIFEDSAKTVWVGTYGNGLNRYDRAKGTFSHYTVRDGLPSNVICGILEGEVGDLWISTYGGLSRFDLHSGRFTNYTRADGLQSNEFNLRACFKAKNGTLFFGGPGGFNAFKPRAIKDNTFIPPLVFTRIRLFGGETPAREHRFLPGGILEISMRESFTVEFAALDFTNPEKNLYAYRLEGLTPDWIPLGNRRELTFAGLSPGTYTLQVKGSNSDGKWNEAGIALEIRVAPPFWLAPWFRVLVGLALASFLAVGYWVRVRRLKQRKEELEREVASRTLQLAHSNTELEVINADLQRQIRERERFELALEESNLKLQNSVEKLQEMDQTKTELMNVVSHELRTPLTSVVGFAKVVRRKLDESLFPALNKGDKKIEKTVGQVGGNMEIIVAEGERLTNLINDFLDIAKMEAGKIAWNMASLRVEEVADRAEAAVRPLLEERRLRWQRRLADDLPEAWGDRDRLVQVLINLLSNAVKFTPEGGTITLSVDRSGADDPSVPRTVQRPDSLRDGTCLRVSVADTGPGIAPECLEQVFEKFSQLKNAPPGAAKGTGLGLPICRQIVESHGGRIWASSEPGQGSRFTFLLPAAEGQRAPSQA